MNGRQRGTVSMALAVVVIVGLASRRVDAAPDLIGTHAGDTLWATALVLALSLVWRGGRPGQVALLGFVVAVGVELSQRWRPTWLAELRENELVALVLGRGFLWGDIVRYAVGCVFAWLLLRTVVVSTRACDAF